MNGKNSPQDVQHKNDMSEDESLLRGRLGGNESPGICQNQFNSSLPIEKETPLTTDMELEIQNTSANISTDYHCSTSASNNKMKNSTPPTISAVQVENNEYFGENETEQNIKSSKSLNINQPFVHVIVPYDHLREIVNNNLGFCRECGEKSLELKYQQNVGYAVTLAVVCQACENTMNKLRVAEHHDRKKRSLTKGTTQTGRQEISRLNTKIWRNKKQRTAIQNTIKSNMVLPLSIQNTTLNQYAPPRCFENYNVNIRAILITFFLELVGKM